MNDIERLIAIEEIKQLKGRYLRALDLKDWDLMSTIFTDDAVADYRGGATNPHTGINAVPGPTEGIQIGGDTIVRGLSGAVAKMDVAIHHVSVPEIKITSETTAEAIWPMINRNRMQPGGPVSEEIGWGHYHETYESVDGQWKIKTLRLSRLRVDHI
jgi:hypothetical protein